MQYMEAMNEALDSLIDSYNSYSGQESKVVFTTGYMGRKISLIVDKNPEILQLLKNVNITQPVSCACYFIMDKNITYRPLELSVSFPTSGGDNLDELDRIARKVTSAGIHPSIVATNLRWSTPKASSLKMRMSGPATLKTVSMPRGTIMNGVPIDDELRTETLHLKGEIKTDGFAINGYNGEGTTHFTSLYLDVVSDLPLREELASEFQSDKYRHALLPSDVFKDS